MNKIFVHTCFLCLLVLGTVSCGTSLVIEDVDYSQPIESVLTPNSDQVVNDQRYAIKFSLTPILENEGISSVQEIRLIRNRDGFYFVTASGFQHVYVFEPGEGELELEEAIEFMDTTLQEPAFNQRNEYIELVDLSDGTIYRLNQEGIVEEDTE